MKGLQQKYGKDKLDVLLLSVDFTWSQSKEDAIEKNRKSLDKAQVTWPNAMLPQGWTDTRKLFNLDGYGLSLVGPDGVVRGVDIHTDKAEKLLDKIFQP